jgi:hypothetical protein
VKYPGDMMASLSTTRADRWKEARNYTDLDSVKEQLKRDSSKCRVIGFRYDAEKDIFESEGDNSINCMDVIFENADKAQKGASWCNNQEKEQSQHKKTYQQSPKKRKILSSSSDSFPQFLIDENSSSPLYPKESSRPRKQKKKNYKDFLDDDHPFASI